MKCLNCNKETSNPKFCSRSCSAKKNNIIYKKRKVKTKLCYRCGESFSGRRKICPTCSKNNIDWTNVTYKEVCSGRKYQKNSRIRNISRALYKKSNRPKQCEVCGYDKHYELHHIKEISSFPLDTFVSEIIKLSNVLAVCPNCHWEIHHP